MTRIPVPDPIGGLHTDTSISGQPPQTTRQVSNMRPIDPTSGRRRLSSRAGMADILGGSLSGAGDPVRAMATLVKNEKRTTYGEQAPVTTWEYVSDAGESALGVKADAQGNTYWLSARDTVTSRNSAGKVLWKLTLPVVDASQVVRALDVTPDGVVFCGVSEGSDVANSRLWSYGQIRNDEGPVQIFEIQNVGWIQDVSYHEGRLYTLQDRPKEGRSYLTVYRDARTATPQLDSDNDQIAHPAAGLDVGPDGAAYVASPQSFTRGVDPRYPNLSPTRVDFQLGDLEHIEDRLWFWTRADAHAGLYSDGDEVRNVLDLSGNGRNLTPQSGHPGVQFVEKGVGDKPTLRFDPTYNPASYGSNGSALQSYENLNSNTDPDRIYTILPSYAGARFAAFFLLRRVDTASTGIEIILQQTLGTAGSDSLKLRANFADTGAATDGFVTLTEDASGSPVHHKDGVYEEFILVTILWNVDGTGRCYYRVNGTPWSTFTAFGDTEGALKEQTFIGFCTVGTNNGVGLHADLIEAIVLRDYKDEAGATQLITSPNYPTGVWSSSSDTEVEWIEGMLAWEYGCQHFLDDGTATGLDVTGATAQPWPHPYHLRPRFQFTDAAWNTAAQTIIKTGAFANYTQTLVPGKFDTIEIYDAGAGTANTYQIASKDSDNQITLVAPLSTNPTETVSGAFLGFISTDADVSTGGPPTGVARASTAALRLSQAYWRHNISYPAILEKWSGGDLVVNVSRTGGVGHGVVVRQRDTDGDDEPDTTFVWSLGPQYLNRTEFLRKFTDNGTTLSATNALGSSTFIPDYQYARMDVDSNGTVYFPMHDDGTAFPAGPQAVGWTNEDFTYGIMTHALADAQQGYAVVADPNIPDYETDPVKLAEYIYVATSNEGDEALTTQHRLQMVSRTLDAGASPRTQIDLAVAGGTVYRFETGVGVTVTGGALTPNSPWTQMHEFAGEIYMTDGANGFVFTDDEVLEPWVSTSAGEVPRGFKLMMVHAGRIWIGRTEDDPYLWACSAKDDARNWDFDPVVATVSQAVVGPLSEAGKTPDILTAMIPWTDATRDERTGAMGVFGCDHSIWVIEGDPAAGGTIYLKTNSMGIAYGVKPWCVSPRNVLYFINDDGQFCMWTLGGNPEPLSEGRVDQRFREIDLGTYMPFLVYDRRARGVHVYLTPYGATHAVVVDHYFFCEESHGIKELGVGRSGAFGSFWPDTFGLAGLQPICALLRDGDDPGDRRLLLGCSDGFIREVSGNYDDDDGTPIASDVVYRVPGTEDSEVVYSGFEVVLAEGQFGANVSVYAHAGPQEGMGQPVTSWLADPGRNGRVYQPTRASMCYVRIRGNTRFAIEGVSCSARKAGMKRWRA